MTPTVKLTPDVLFEDEVLLVINKPAGLVVHPAPSYKGLTLLDWIRDYLGSSAVADFEEVDRLGLVHRLDKDTSGVLVVTKTPEAKTALGRQFHDRLVQKEYIAFVQGVPPKKKGIISAPIGRSLKVPSRMAITGNGRPSETSFEIEEDMKEVALMHLFPKTGRTHQIRVHCAAIGHPVVGDAIYGASAKWKRDYGIERLLLHAHKIEVTHPKTGKRVRFEAPWPADMKKARTRFRKAFLLAMAALVTSLGQAAPQKKKSPSPDSSAVANAPVKSTASTSSAARKEMAALKEQFKSLILEVSALQDQFTALKSSFDEMAGSRRLHDLEKAISDLNGKSVSTASVSEENKTQLLDLSRKVKAQQEMVDQMRDQIDKLQREAIQSRGREPEPVSTMPTERAQ